MRGQVRELSSEEQAFMKDPRWCLKVAIEEASASALALSRTGAWCHEEGELLLRGG